MTGIFWKRVVPIFAALQSGCVLCFQARTNNNFGKQSPDNIQRIKKCVVDYAVGLDKVHKNLGDTVRGHPLIARTTLKNNVILGAGFGSTATRSLDTALGLLGLKGDHYSGAMAPMREVLALPNCGVKLDKLFNDTKMFATLNDYILDTPMAELFLDFFMTFSEAKFILTTRPAEMWTASRSKKSSADVYMPRERPCADHLKGNPSKNISYMFNLHNELVRCVVPKDRLFEIDVWSDPQDRMDHVMEHLATFTGRKLSLHPSKTALKVVATNNTTKRCTSKSLHSRLSSFMRAKARPADNGTISIVHENLKMNISPRDFGAVMQAASLEDCEIILEKNQ